MNRETGEIITPKQVKVAMESLGPGKFKEQYVPMKVAPTAAQLLRKPPRVGRNERCPCGSELKAKKCCLVGKQE